MINAMFKGGLNAPAEIIDSGQIAQYAQADLDRNVLLLVSFLQHKGQENLISQLVVTQNVFHRSYDNFDHA